MNGGTVKSGQPWNLCLMGFLLLGILFSGGCLEPQQVEAAKQWVKPIEETPWEKETVPSDLSAQILSSEAESDGQIWDSGDGYVTYGGPTVGMVVGDAPRYLSRGYLSFNIIPLPKDAEIRSANLYVFQHWVVHGNPFEIGNVYITSHNYPLGIFKEPVERKFTPEDRYVYGELPSSVSEMVGWKLVSNRSWEGWRNIDVTQWVEEDIKEGKSHSQFMLALFSCTETQGSFRCAETDGDDEKDSLIFSTKEGLPTLSSEYAPHLIVRYSLPEEGK